MHETIVAAAAEASDDLTARYVEGQRLSSEEIRRGLRERTLRAEVVPVTCGAAFRNIGIHNVLDAIVDFLPSPEDVAPPVVMPPARLLPDESEPFAALAFKLAHDRDLGSLVFLRVYAGKVRVGEHVINARTGARQRVECLVQVHANEYEPIAEACSGDIAAISGLHDVRTGDTLCAPERVLVLQPLVVPEPVISVAIEPRTAEDGAGLCQALDRFVHEDPSLQVSTDPDSGQTILSGMGELHLEIIVDRIKREFGVQTRVGRPRVAYREAIRRTVEAQGKCIREIGGRGQYAHVCLRLEPSAVDAGYEFGSQVAGESIPPAFVPSIDEGIREQMRLGVSAGYPLRSLKVTVFDGSWHETDSGPDAFRAAGASALREGVRRAEPYLLEPVMLVEVSTPENFMGTVIGELNRRRGTIQGMTEGFGSKIIAAEVPLSEMFGYATGLRSATQGLGTYSMEFRKYSEVPANIAATIIAGNTVS
jgi:elongation factor G